MGIFFRSNKKGGIIPTGTKQITISSAGTSTHDVSGYADAEVTTSGLVVPTGTKQISINAAGTTTHNVSGYESAEVTTSGLVVPSGDKAITVNAASASDIDVANYSTASYSVNTETKYVSPSTSGFWVSHSSGKQFFTDVYVYGYSSASRTLLWSNPSPSSSYSGNTTITLNYAATNYNALLIKYTPWVGGSGEIGEYHYAIFAPPSKYQETSNSKDFTNMVLMYTGTSYTHYRKLYFAKAYSDYQHLYIGADKSISDGAANQKGVVPAAIYGISGISSILS